MSTGVMETLVRGHPRYCEEHVLYLRGRYATIYSWAVSRGIELEIVCTLADFVTVVLVPNPDARLLLSLQFSSLPAQSKVQ